MEIVHWAMFTSLFAVGTLPLTFTLTTQFAPVVPAGVFFLLLGCSIVAFHEHRTDGVV